MIRYQIKLVQDITDGLGTTVLETYGDGPALLATLAELLEHITGGMTEGMVTVEDAGKLKVDRAPAPTTFYKGARIHAIIITPIARTTADVQGPGRKKGAGDGQDD